MTIVEDDRFYVRAFPVQHRGPDCFGFVFQEKSRHPFLAEKAALLGIPVGPERKTLVSGKPITLPDGRVISPEDVLGEPVPGAKLVFIGDCGRTDNLVQHARNADLLVTEATYLEEEAEMAEQFGHLTAARAAALAVEANVDQLCLTHLSRRYRENDVQMEAQAVFPNARVVRDFDRIQTSKTK